MTHEQTVAKIAELIHGIRFAMFTSVDESGKLLSRPMATQQTPFDGTVWFFTQRDTEKVDEFRRNPNVNVAYADPKGNRWVSLSGTASLVNDMDRKRELWQEPLKAWFPKGLDDPSLTLIRVDAESAEYWDSPDSKLVVVAGYLKARFTGKPANDLGENRTVDL